MYFMQAGKRRGYVSRHVAVSYILWGCSEQVMDSLPRGRVIRGSQISVVGDSRDYLCNVVRIVGRAPCGLASIQKMIRIGVTVDDRSDEDQFLDQFRMFNGEFNRELATMRAADNHCPANF